MKLYITTIFLLSAVGSFSQSVLDSVLVMIEKNNTTLSALRENLEADRIGNKTGLWPSNPEAEFNYLRGYPRAIGDRTDIAVRQVFDFPTAYAYKSQISELKNEQAELVYERQRKDILHEARMIVAEVILQNALITDYNLRAHHAGEIAESYRKKLDAGEANILEYNRAQVYLLNVSKKTEIAEIERDALLAELLRLNGGLPVEFSENLLYQPPVTGNFEQWYAMAEQNNPVLKWIRQELALNQKQKQLQVSQTLPRISAGYMSEKVVGEHFQGVTMGISIPLWENKNAVRHASAKIIATEKLQADAKLQFYIEMKTRYEKVAALQNSISSYERMLETFNSRQLLLKALNSGEISLNEYFVELGLYYDSMSKLHEMKHDMIIAWFELVRFQ